MEHYVGLDVSLKETHVCVLDEQGSIICRGRVASEVAALASYLRRRAPLARRIVLEAGSLSGWLWHGLRDLGLGVDCVDSRQAHAFLRRKVQKTDANDAEGLARLAHWGGYEALWVKSLASQELRGLLLARQRLVRLRRDLENGVRGLLKPLGLVVGAAVGRRFESRVERLVEGQSELTALVAPLMTVRRCALAECAALDRRLGGLARGHEVCRRLMTVPGVGPLTALAYVCVLDDPRRFARSARVAAYLGLVPRRYQSGEIDRTGRIAKSGDGLVRHLLYEAATVLLTRVKGHCALKAWGLRLARRKGFKKACVALARKLALLLHRLWLKDEEFHWRRQPAA